MSDPSRGTEVITAREDALYAAMLAFDYAALDGLLSDELSYVHSTGVVESKAAYFAGLRERLYEYGAIATISARTKLFADAAVTGGVIDMLVGAKGGPKGTIRLQHVLVWQKESGIWRLLLRQATRLPG